ncbi:DoxX family protein [Streptacidiphilus fuscans]|uniref:DoxX family protein n=1 Tax=Streptacidiphilus fuscans TaxID=2789292 RepID=A0A931AXS4_9ACTN|nr:DoxX family protein [Streptacidiphilus fuscans]MBF9066686.1 DoxX family protein [Streptacidiphilus fuscans]
MNTGLLLLRLVAGLLIAGHGVQKVSFHLGGRGLEGGTEEFRGDGFRGGVLTALAAGGSQIGAGLFLALGLLTPLAAAGAMGVMTVAFTVKWRHGLWVQNDGYEYPFVLIVIAAVLAATGPGAWSVDGALGIAAWPLWWLPVAVVAGVGGGLATRLALHREPRHPADVTVLTPRG